MRNDLLDNYKKSLRQNQTEAEQRLWYYLRGRRFKDYKFRRQQILQGYITDFVCLDKKLIIEIDGSQHADQVNYDENRSKLLEADGFKILRFWNNEVLEETAVVLDVIFNCLNEGGYFNYPSSGASHHLLPQGEKGNKKHSFLVIGEKAKKSIFILLLLRKEIKSILFLIKRDGGINVSLSLIREEEKNFLNLSKGNKNVTHRRCQYST